MQCIISISMLENVPLTQGSNPGHRRGRQRRKTLSQHYDFLGPAYQKTAWRLSHGLLIPGNKRCHKNKHAHTTSSYCTICDQNHLYHNKNIRFSEMYVESARERRLKCKREMSLFPAVIDILGMLVKSCHKRRFFRPLPTAGSISFPRLHVE
jgi:hypothetical protein